MRIDLMRASRFIVGGIHPLVGINVLHSLAMQMASHSNSGPNIIRGEPERAPNTRGTGSGFICMYIYIYIYIYICIHVCLWGNHFSEERVKF